MLTPASALRSLSAAARRRPSIDRARRLDSAKLPRDEMTTVAIRWALLPAQVGSFASRNTSDEHSVRIMAAVNLLGRSSPRDQRATDPNTPTP